MDVLDATAALGSPPTSAQAILDIVKLIPAPVPIEPTVRYGSYVDWILQVGIELADALAFAHAEGICHSDIKPSNVLITENGHAKLFDFNLSFSEDSERGFAGGTVPYMAPEQLQAAVKSSNGHIDSVDERADLFQLGATLYQLFCGQLPFGPLPTEQPISETAEVLRERQRHGPQSLRKLNQYVDAKLGRVIERCLAFDPDERPQSAHELVTALKSQATTSRRAVRWGRRNPRNFVAVLISFMAISLLYFNFDPTPAGAVTDTLTVSTINAATPPPPLLSDLLNSSSAGIDASGEVRSRMALQLNLLLLEKGHAKLARTRAYTAIAFKQERIRGTLGEKQVIQLKVRHEPFSVYMNRHFPDGI